MVMYSSRLDCIILYHWLLGTMEMTHLVIINLDHPVSTSAT